jgi:hypothetical protein
MIVPGYAAPERVCNTCFTQTNPRHVPDRTRSMSNTGGGGGGGGGVCCRLVSCVEEAIDA